MIIFVYFIPWKKNSYPLHRQQQQQVIPASAVPPAAPVINICMLCRSTGYDTAHEDPTITTEDFNDIKSLASRLTVGIHTDPGRSFRHVGTAPYTA